MAHEHLEKLYNVLDESTTILHQQLKTSFIAAVIEAGEDLASGKETVFPTMKLKRS